MDLRIGIAPHGQVALRVVSRQKDVFGGMAAAEKPEMVREVTMRAMLDTMFTLLATFM